MEVIHANNDNFNELIKDGTVIVDMFANWCGPCKMLGPVIEELASKYSDIKFIKVDVDECEELAKRFGVMSIPTIIKFQDGKEIDKKIGYMNIDDFDTWLNK